MAPEVDLTTRVLQGLRGIHWQDDAAEAVEVYVTKKISTTFFQTATILS